MSLKGINKKSSYVFGDRREIYIQSSSVVRAGNLNQDVIESKLSHDMSSYFFTGCYVVPNVQFTCTCIFITCAFISKLNSPISYRRMYFLSEYEDIQLYHFTNSLFLNAHLCSGRICFKCIKYTFTFALSWFQLG